MPVDQMDTQLNYIWITVVAALTNANFLILCFLCVQLQLEWSANVQLKKKSKQAQIQHIMATLNIYLQIQILFCYWL